MLNAIIIEDEKPAMELLADMLAHVAIKINILARLGSVNDSIEYISHHPGIDIIFSDVQLPDGLAFDIFDQTGVRIPVIFITGYDKYVMKAFDNNGIDYLLKPVDKAELEKALSKYYKLKTYFSHSTEHELSLGKFMNGRKKKRLLVKKGSENVSLALEDIVIIYTQNKLAFVIDRSSKKYVSDKTLTELEQELDPSIFFRANRQYIVNIQYIKGFKSFERVKLLVDILMPQLNHSIVVSQELAPVFRKWMHDA